MPTLVYHSIHKKERRVQSRSWWGFISFQKERKIRILISKHCLVYLWTIRRWRAREGTPPSPGSDLISYIIGTSQLGFLSLIRSQFLPGLDPRERPQTDCEVVDLVRLLVFRLHFLSLRIRSLCTISCWWAAICFGWYLLSLSILSTLTVPTQINYENEYCYYNLAVVWGGSGGTWFISDRVSCVVWQGDVWSMTDQQMITHLVMWLVTLQAQALPRQYTQPSEIWYEYQGKALRSTLLTHQILLLYSPSKTVSCNDKYRDHPLHLNHC